MTPSNSTGDLTNWLERIEKGHPREIELGLDRVLVVLRRLFPKAPPGKVVSVAGTNGKGSTVAALESILITGGEKVGAYSSPHISRFNERIRVNGREVSDETLCEAFDLVEKARQGTPLTYFEFTTLAAFVVFEGAGCDYWLLEVGLGGRLDAVNALDPDLAIITSIGLDHVAWLGNDRESIGYEKAGILRPGIPAICTDRNPPDSLLAQARAQQVILYRLGRDIDLGEHGLVLESESGRERFEMRSGLPAESLGAAALAARLLMPDWENQLIQTGLDRASLAGRFEEAASEPRVILDVGHNADAAAWLANRLTGSGFSKGRIVAVYAGLSDKDSRSVMEALNPVVDQWHIASLSVDRGLSSAELAQRGEGLLPSTVPQYESVGDAMAAALEGAADNDEILVFGSFFTVAEARRYFEGVPAP